MSNHLQPGPVAFHTSSEQPIKLAMLYTSLCCMGEVYEVEHTVLRRRYALKLLPDNFATHTGAAAGSPITT